MTPRQESLYPADWRAVARQDWHRIHVRLADGDADGPAFLAAGLRAGPGVQVESTVPMKRELRAVRKAQVQVVESTVAMKRELKEISTSASTFLS